MDLRLLVDEPTAEERDAVDAVLGPALADWAGPDAPRTATPGTAGTPPGPSATCCCPCCTRCTSRGLDQPGGAELHRPPPDHPARGRLRRRHVLRAVLARAAPAARRARVRRPRLPLRGVGGADRRARPGGRGARRRDLAAQPVPGPVRPRARRAAHRGRRDAAGARAGRPSTPTACGRSSAARRRRRRRRPRRRSSASPGCGCSPASARSTRRASTTTAPTAGTRRCGGRSTSAPRA